MIEIVYISAARAPFSATELRTLLQRSRAANAAAGITGLLLHSGQSFLQVLEGADEAVNATYQRILLDRRHHQVLRLFKGVIARRSFADWSMGYAGPHRQAVADAAGFNEALEKGLRTTGSGDSAQRILDLVNQFRQGRWRQHVEHDSGRSG